MLIGVQLQLLQRICRTIEMISFGVKIFSLMELLLYLSYLQKKKRSYITFHSEKNFIIV